jgi:glycosyltransferase involved in cell wall biosynthesis
LFLKLSNVTLVPVSFWLKDLIQNSFFQHNYPIKVIHNGIDSRIFVPQNTEKVKVKLNLADKFIILGVASVWDRRKGLEDFIRLSYELEKDEIIILVGLTHKQRTALPANIIGVSKTENISELVDLYSAADVFLNTTIEDNFPTVNLEAMACGTPVITYPTGGCPEAISAETGIIVETGNISEIKKALNVIKLNTRQSYSKACTEHVCSFFNKTDRYDEYIKLYESLMRNS